MSMYICPPSSFHPYECSHDKYCEHCTWAEFEGHNPQKCALCREMDFRLCKEPFAIRIKPYDLTPRQQRIKVTTIITRMLENPQKELPF